MGEGEGGERSKGGCLEKCHAIVMPLRCHGIMPAACMQEPQQSLGFMTVAFGSQLQPRPAYLGFLLSRSTKPALGSMASAQPVGFGTAASWPPPRCPGADDALWAALAQLEPGQQLDFAELFAGNGAVGRALAALGYRGRALDREYHEGHDLLTSVGFLTALQTALDLKPGGIMWLAPPCSTWVWLARHTYGRHLAVQGDFTQPKVLQNNALVERVVLLLEVVTARRAFWLVEQPTSSVLWHYPAMQGCLQRHGCMPQSLEMGAYGGTSVKPTTLMGTAPYLHFLGGKCTPALRARLELEGVSTTRRWTDAEGHRRCQGTTELRGTQAYPEGFGASHALAFQASFGAASPSVEAHVSTWPPAGGLAELLPAAMQEALQGAWWLRDFCGEPFV